MDRKIVSLPSTRIPERSSSRSPEKGGSSAKRIRDLESERKECKEAVERQRKKVKLCSSFDTTYWTARRDLVEKQIQATRLNKQISIAKLKDNTKAFIESEEGQNLVLHENSLKLDMKLYDAQAEKMKPKDEKFKFRRSFMELFMGAETGLGAKTCRGKRESSLQSAFREDLRSKMDSDHPAPKRPYSWCPVTGDYWPRVYMVAGHLFPWKCGENTMEAIFGSSDSGQSELFQAENGILWSQDAERRFEGGHFVIVPDTVDAPTQQEMDTWEASNPKEYKIRVLNPKHSLMQEYIHKDRDKIWVDIDNNRLQFKTNFRPRARYLYFAYCAAMLRRSFGGQHLETSKAELRTRFWGTPGRYMPEGMLLGFVEAMGHEYEHLLEGAIKEENAVAEPTAVAAANTHIREAPKVYDPDSRFGFHDDSDDDSSSDEDEDEDGGEKISWGWRPSMRKSPY